MLSVSCRFGLSDRRTVPRCVCRDGFPAGNHGARTARKTDRLQRRRDSGPTPLACDPNRITNMFGERARLPHLKGMSGCGMWRLCDPDANAPQTWTLSSIRLVGIEHTWHERSRESHRAGAAQSEAKHRDHTPRRAAVDTRSEALDGRHFFCGLPHDPRPVRGQPLHWRAKERPTPRLSGFIDRLNARDVGLTLHSRPRFELLYRGRSADSMSWAIPAAYDSVTRRLTARFNARAAWVSGEFCSIEYRCASAVFRSVPRTSGARQSTDGLATHDDEPAALSSWKPTRLAIMPRHPPTTKPASCGCRVVKARVRVVARSTS